MKYTPLLSLDGGGSRALFFLQILKHIELTSKRRVAELFKLVAGTSAGGIVALALTCTDMSAIEIEALFLKLCPVLFAKPLGADLRALFSPRYSPTPLAKALQPLFGVKQLSQAKTPVLVTSFQLQTFEPFLFSNFGAGSEAYAADAALATSAGPTLFPPHIISGAPFIDGGLIHNNPALLALHAAQGLPNPLLLSLGTGVPKEGWSAKDSAGWGELSWISPALAVCIDGAGKQVHEQCASILPSDQYLRVQVVLDDASVDQNTPDQLADLIAAGEHWIVDNKQQLDSFLGKLIGATP